MVWLCGTGAPALSSLARPAPRPVRRAARSAGRSRRPKWSGPAAPSSSAAGEFAEFVAALKKELAYANVHTSTSGGGEIRGQIKRWSHR